MKIIGVSNFDNESAADILICENISEYFGNIVVAYLNEIAGEYDDYYFKLVDNDHKQWKGMEELV